MAKDILGEFGKDSYQPQQPVIRKGGCMPGDTKDVMNYSPPYGPKNIMDPKSPGLHGENQGTTNGPDSGGRHSGSPGLGGKVRQNGSQGRY